MQIKKVHAVPIFGAYYYDDITALQRKSIPEPERFTAPAVTPGFRFVREPAEGVSLGLELEDGSLHWGDCLSVSYGGKAGRKGLFRHSDLPFAKGQLEERFLGADATTFRGLAKKWNDPELVPAVQYGVSQACLRASAYLHRVIPCTILCREWNLPIPERAVPIQGSSGNDRKGNADKMIVHRLAALPHSQIDDIETQLGQEGEILLDYTRWLMNRIVEIGGSDYRPTIHLDVHGAIAKIFGQEVGKISAYLGALKKIVSPLPLRMESVFVADSLENQIDCYGKLRERLRADGIDVALVVDEWANTKEDILQFARSGTVDMIHIKMPDLGGVDQSLEAVLEVKALGVGTLLGGSCIETENSSALSVHVALAAQPDVFLAKPGMGVNEAIAIAKNEMARGLAGVSFRT